MLPSSPIKEVSPLQTSTGEVSVERPKLSVAWSKSTFVVVEESSEQPKKRPIERLVRAFIPKFFPDSIVNPFLKVDSFCS